MDAIRNAPEPDANQATWTAVDEYISGSLVGEDEVLTAALRDSVAAGLPQHHVSAPQGKLLCLLARMQQARTILEVGTLAGYSTIWLAHALPATGRLITIEMNPLHAKVARENVHRAGLSERVDCRVGKAIEILPSLIDESPAPFDLIFLDADKAGTPEYFAWALKLSRAGTVIVADNVIRNGALADALSNDPNVVGVRRFHEMLAAEPRVSATTIQTVGAKGYDGFTLVLVLDPNPQAPQPHEQAIRKH
jgi:predicted O-methyltransferase YrrM